MRILPNAGSCDVILLAGVAGLEHEPTLAVEVSRGRGPFAPAVEPAFAPHGPGDYAVRLQAEDLNGFGDVTVRLLVAGAVAYREVVGYVPDYLVNANAQTIQEQVGATDGLVRLGDLIGPAPTP